MTKILKVSAAAVRPLRDKILRENLPPGSVYPGDDSSDAHHLAAYSGSEIIAVGTIFREQFPDRPELDAWRIRGMATVTEHQREGIGRQIAVQLINYALMQEADAVWCQARTVKRPFYHKLGLVNVGQEYEDSDYPNLRFIKMIQYFSNNGKR